MSLFKVEVSSIEPFRNLVKALAAVVQEGCFDIDVEKIKLLAMDPSHVAMVDFELPREFFDEYLCEGKPRLSLRIGEFLKFLDRVEKDERVKIRLDKERARLVVRCIRPGHTRRFEMAILEPLDEEFPQPKILFRSSARILTQGLKQAIRDADLVSEHIKIEATLLGYDVDEGVLELGLDQVLVDGAELTVVLNRGRRRSDLNVLLDGESVSYKVLDEKDLSYVSLQLSPGVSRLSVVLGSPPPERVPFLQTLLGQRLVTLLLIILLVMFVLLTWR